MTGLTERGIEVTKQSESNDVIEKLSPEVSVKTSTKFSGEKFFIRLTDKDREKLDELHDGGGSVAEFFMKKMKLYGKIPPGQEGDAFQKDLELFMEVL